jgi:hypothetical protein
VDFAGALGGEGGFIDDDALDIWMRWLHPVRRERCHAELLVSRYELKLGYQTIRRRRLV